MLNDDKVTSVRFLKGKVLATRISQEKKFEPYFRVPIKYPINLQDYTIMISVALLSNSKVSAFFAIVFVKRFRVFVRISQTLHTRDVVASWAFHFVIKT